MNQAKTRVSQGVYASGGSWPMTLPGAGGG